MGTQAVGRTRTAAEVTQMSRMFGLVGGDLMWTQDMAAFGREEMTSYASGRLGRVDAPEEPSQDGVVRVDDAAASTPVAEPGTESR